MWIGTAAAQNMMGDRQIVGAENSKPAANVTITFSARASNGTPHVRAGRQRARNNTSDLSRSAIQAPPKNVWTSQAAHTRTAPPPIALQKWPQCP